MYHLPKYLKGTTLLHFSPSMAQGRYDTVWDMYGMVSPKLLSLPYHIFKSSEPWRCSLCSVSRIIVLYTIDLYLYIIMISVHASFHIWCTVNHIFTDRYFAHEQSQDCAVNPWFVHGTNHGSEVCAGQSLDCANPCFAHNIYISKQHEIERRTNL